MRVGGTANRIELKPETEAEREALQKLIDGRATVYYGDSDDFPGGAVVINTAAAPRGAEPAA